MRSGHYHIKEVSTRKELLEVFDLVRESYINSGYIQKDKGLDVINFCHLFVPTTKILINVYKKKIISTATFFIDTTFFGLPSDNIYPDKYKQLREEDRKLVEGGLLAGDQGRPLLHLMSNFFQAAKEIAADDILLVVNPKHVHFYKNMLYFEIFGKVKKCPRANNAPGVLVRFNIKDFDPNKVKNKTLQRIFLS